MKKTFLGLVLTAFLFVAGATAALANEGVFRLAGSTPGSGRCFAASIYIDTSYKVLMTCRGLVVASDPVYNKYVVWTQIGERTQRIGEIVSGKMSSNIPDKFDALFVTLEADAFPSKPTGATVLTGKLEQIDFGTGLAPIVTGQPVGVSPTPTISPARLGTLPAAATPAPTQDQNRLTALVVGIGRAILFGFILLLIVVGVMSFLARRKNL